MKEVMTKETIIAKNNLLRQIRSAEKKADTAWERGNIAENSYLALSRDADALPRDAVLFGSPAALDALKKVRVARKRAIAAYDKYLLARDAANALSDSYTSLVKGEMI